MEKYESTFSGVASNLDFMWSIFVPNPQTMKKYLLILLISRIYSTTFDPYIYINILGKYFEMIYDVTDKNGDIFFIRAFTQLCIEGVKIIQNNFFKLLKTQHRNVQTGNTLLYIAQFFR